MTTAVPEEATDALVELERVGPVARVVLNRPGKRNAMNDALLDRLRAVLAMVREDGSVRAVVLAARGPAFCSGADRSALEGLEGAERARVFAPIALRIAEKIRLAVTEIVASRKPVVAAVNGPAAGGGMMLALACDLLVVSEEARFWMPEITLGRAVGDPALQTLLAYLGAPVTKRILLTGDRLSAGDLQQLGLVTELVAPDAVDRAALLLAHRIAGFEADALEKVKRRANVDLVSIWGDGEAPREIG